MKSFAPAVVLTSAVILTSACAGREVKEGLAVAEDFSLDISWNLFLIFAGASAAVLLTILWPKHLAAIGATITHNPMHAGGVGLLSFGLSMPVLAVAALTLILIPLSLAGVLVLGMGLAAGWAALSLVLGRRLQTMLDEDWTPGLAAGIGALVLGGVFAAAGQIPCLGWAIQLGLAAVGLGAVVMTRFGAVRLQPDL